MGFRNIHSYLSPGILLPHKSIYSRNRQCWNLLQQGYPLRLHYFLLPACKWQGLKTTIGIGGKTIIILNNTTHHLHNLTSIEQIKTAICKTNRRSTPPPYSIPPTTPADKSLPTSRPCSVYRSSATGSSRCSGVRARQQC